METVTERIAIPAGYGDLPHGMSMKGSLAFVRNSMQLKLQLAFIEFSEYSGSRESSTKSMVMVNLECQMSGHFHL
ncbi:UNVERIFIED_CONTAM: hypothetical protein Sangu_3014500 [Sesamum angustifolium]|uniref:Uncharacterized protein n=1 Tax=Sesamum angustifolium TaxID=2727405 RepID=A0AAW2KNW2_9LAMI